MKKLIHKDDRSPWGKVEDVQYLTPWLTQVSTASHGGYKLDRAHNAIIPEYMRKKGGWYEEDCAYSIVFSVLEHLIKQNLFDFSKTFYSKFLDERSYIESFRNWYPSEYEMYFNVTLQEGESKIKDQNLWMERNKDKWHVVSASSISYSNVCKISLTLNGDRWKMNTNEEKIIFMDREEYTRLQTPFGTALSDEEVEKYAPFFE